MAADISNVSTKREHYDDHQDITASRKRRHLNDPFLTCSLCSELYNNVNHQAKLLPCLHSFCKSCLQNSIAGGGENFDCQKCEKTINLPGGTVDGLPDNFLVENLQKRQEKKAQPCGNCDYGDPAVRFCEDCDSYQCNNCVENHRSMRSLQNHKLSTMSNELQDQSIPVQHQCCMKHEAQPMSLYCKEERCQVPVCASCCQDDHQSHNIVDLELVAREIKTNMSDCSSRVTDKHDEIHNKRDALEIAQKKLTSGFKLQEAEIQKSKKILQDLIDSIYSNAQSNLKDTYDEEMSRLTEHIESMDSLAAEMAFACEFTDKVCDVTPPAQLLTYHQQIMARLQELENTKLPDVIANHTKFTFTGKHHSSMKEIDESLCKICDMDWKREVEPSRCTILSNEENSTNNYVAIVQTADMYGENLTIGGVQIRAKVCWRAYGSEHSISRSVRDNNDGTYTFTYYVKNHSDVHVTINGKEINGSPFQIVESRKR